MLVGAEEVVVIAGDRRGRERMNVQGAALQLVLDALLEGVPALPAIWARFGREIGRARRPKLEHLVGRSTK